MKRVIALLVSLGVFFLCGYLLVCQTNSMVEGVRILVTIAALGFGLMTLYQLLMLTDDEHKK